MPQGKRTAQERSRLPATEAAALAALSVSESLLLAMVESGCLDLPTLRRCLLDAAAAHEESIRTEKANAGSSHAVHAEAAKLIDRILRQVDAVAPSRQETNSTRENKSECV